MVKKKYVFQASPGGEQQHNTHTHTPRARCAHHHHVPGREYRQCDFPFGYLEARRFPYPSRPTWNEGEGESGVGWEVRERMGAWCGGWCECVCACGWGYRHHRHHRHHPRWAWWVTRSIISSSFNTSGSIKPSRRTSGRVRPGADTDKVGEGVWWV